MTPPDWADVRRIFDAALDCPPAERDAFLDEACAGRETLRSEVKSLLGAYEHSGDFIETPAAEAAAHLLVDQEIPLEGRSIGPYLIRHEIGRGGMGIVYLADDTRLSRRVALKVVAANLGEGRREQIRREARAAATLAHPGIATVYALEEIDHELYLACEYVPGPTLRALIAQGPLSADQVLDIAAQLARALAAAHAQGVVHGDLKPDNVVRTSAGVVKVLDFGVARVQSLVGIESARAAGAAGTPAYMAPEQLRGEEADFRADLFAFGVLVYELATASNPFEGDTVASTSQRLREFSPPFLSAAASPEFMPLDDVVSACLAKNPQARYASTARLVADLERIAGAFAPRIVVGDAQPLRSRWWWCAHQVTVVLLYVLTLYPAWRIRRWLPQPEGTWFFFSVLGCTTAAASIRLHLIFTARVYPTEFRGQLGRLRLWTRVVDALIASLLLAAALAVGRAHPEVATLLVAVSVAAALASFVIEPVTTRAAFGDEPRPGAKSIDTTP